MMHQEKHHRKSKESKEARETVSPEKARVVHWRAMFFSMCWQGKEKGKEKGKKAKQHPFGNSFPYLFGPVPVLNSRDFAFESLQVTRPKQAAKEVEVLNTKQKDDQGAVR